MKKIIALFLFAFLAISALPAGAAPLQAVCSLFPVYELARQVGGDLAHVRLLLPPGAEAHSFEPRPQDVRLMNDAALFVFTGKEMEPWALRIAQSLDGPVIVDASEGIPLLSNEDDPSREEEHEHKHGHHHALDPHVWLDLSLAQKMADNIAAGFCTADPENADSYRRNAAAYKMQLAELDSEIRSIVERSKQRTLVFGGRFACRYFLRHYGLNWVTAYDGENEPGMRRVAEVVRYMREHGIRYLFHDEFAEPRIARSIAEQTGAKLLLFHTAHNLTREELEKNITFLDIMKANRNALTLALAP
ncbi:MAG: zinc ABC transporter substrate-binding protein [Fretibacterium sp.]|nr:zinc ABC transporter substrate-binding protein [Fretibacterium sp.]